MIYSMKCMMTLFILLWWTKCNRTLVKVDLEDWGLALQYQWCIQVVETEYPTPKSSPPKPRILCETLNGEQVKTLYHVTPYNHTPTTATTNSILTTWVKCLVLFCSAKDHTQNGLLSLLKWFVNHNILAPLTLNKAVVPCTKVVQSIVCIGMPSPVDLALCVHLGFYG